MINQFQLLAHDILRKRVPSLFLCHCENFHIDMRSVFARFSTQAIFSDEII